MQLAEGCVEVRVACDGFEPEDRAVGSQGSRFFDGKRMGFRVI